jgi:hypothetical protein
MRRTRHRMGRAWVEFKTEIEMLLRRELDLKGQWLKSVDCLPKSREERVPCGRWPLCLEASSDDVASRRRTFPERASPSQPFEFTRLVSKSRLRDLAAQRLS